LGWVNFQRQNRVSFQREFSLNKACNLACERGSFSYHLIRNYLEEGIMKQEEQQLEIRLQQTSDIIRSPREYAHIVGELEEVES